MLQAAASAALGVLPINKKAFMTELRNLLAFMDEEDRSRVLQRYERMFESAGETGEDALIRSLGSPVRQVLAIEQEYSRSRAEGKTPFLDADEPAAMQDEKDLTTLVREAADALQGQEGDKTLFPAETETAAELDQLLIEEVAADEALPEETPGESAIPDMEETVPETAGEKNAPESEEEKDEPAEAAAEQPPAETPDEPGAEEAAPPVGETEEELPQSELLTNMFDESDELPEKPQKTGAEPEAPAEEASAETAEPERPASPGAGRILAAVVVTLPFLLWWGVGFALSLALGAVFLAVGFAVCVAGVYLGGYALSSVMTFMPDKLLVGGGALGCFAAALLLIWMGLWVIVGGIALVIRTSGKVYRRILNRPETDEEDESNG